MYINASNKLPLRIATYSQDGLGLGHMRRTHLIANQFLELRPDGCVLTLSDSQLGQFFTLAPNHDYVKLPSIVKDGPGNWRAANLSLPFDEVLDLRKELICRAVLNFQPQILLVDHMPHGAMGELLPTLAALRDSGAETKIVLGLRDILDAPQVVQSRWQIEGAYTAVEEYYDRVLIYGMREVFDLAKQYQFSPSLTQRLQYCGYVGAPIRPASDAMKSGATAKTARNSTLKAKFLRGANACTKLIVAMAGGGADAYPMMRTLLEALPAIQSRYPVLLVLITGPFMPPELRQELKARASGLPVRILTAVDDTRPYVEAADLVVAMAGYNTSVEILQSEKRAILIPRRGPSAEQRTRTCLFAARGWVDMVEPDESNGDVVAQVIVKNLSLGPYITTQNKPDLQGVSVAAEQLLSLLPTPAFSLRAPERLRSATYELA